MYRFLMITLLAFLTRKPPLVRPKLLVSVYVPPHWVRPRKAIGYSPDPDPEPITVVSLGMSRTPQPSRTPEMVMTPPLVRVVSRSAHVVTVVPDPLPPPVVPTP